MHTSVPAAPHCGAVQLRVAVDHNQCEFSGVLVLVVLTKRCVTDACHPRVLRRTTPKTVAMVPALGTRINHPSRVCFAPDTLA